VSCKSEHLFFQVSGAFADFRRREISYLHGKRGSGGGLNSEMSLEHVATPVPIPATRTWRSVPSCPSRRSRRRESAPDGAQSSPPLPRGLSPAVSWATWQRELFPHPGFSFGILTKLCSGP
jgi:hypothetical protein